MKKVKRSHKPVNIENLQEFWKNSELGFVPPLKFICVAEETRLINPIGKWVLQKACAFLKKMHEIQDPHISIAVNVFIFQVLKFYSEWEQTRSFII